MTIFATLIGITSAKAIVKYMGGRQQCLVLVLVITIFTILVSVIILEMFSIVEKTNQGEPLFEFPGYCNVE